MKELFFDIKNFSYIENEDFDVTFIPMMTRRKLDKFGRAALYTIYKVYDGGGPNLVFASEYGDYERVVKLIKQRQEDGDVSPSDFSSSVHNACIGLFSLLEKNHASYNSISAGDETISLGLLESILQGKDTIFCYAENIDELKSLSISILANANGKYRLSENNDKTNIKDSFDDLINFLNGKTNIYTSKLFSITRCE